MAKSTLPGKISSHVAQCLKDERIKRKLSLDLLATRAGLSRQMISYVEQEMRKPTLDTLLRICEAMEVRIEDLITRARKTATKPAKK